MKSACGIGVVVVAVLLLLTAASLSGLFTNKLATSTVRRGSGNPHANRTAPETPQLTSTLAPSEPPVRRGRIRLVKSAGNKSEELCFDNEHPCVGLSRLAPHHAVDAPLGVWLNFSSSNRPGIGESSRTEMKLRTAVVNSGHLRTYRLCSGSLINRVLRPNKAHLFLITYSYLAIQLLNETIPPETEFIDLDHVVATYTPHLQQLYLLDDAKVAKAVRAAFPQHGIEYKGLLAKMLTLEVGLVMVAGFLAFDASSSDAAFWRMPASPEALQRAMPYDVILKVRPDIFFIGDLLFYQGSSSSSTADSNKSAHVHFLCAGSRAEYQAAPLTRTAVFRSPHHPTLMWPGDPFSDHAVFGSATAMTNFEVMFTTLQHANAETVGQYLFTKFKMQNTPEKIWSRFAKHQLLDEVHFVGYHVLLRDPEQFTRGANVREALKNSRLKKALLIFGITDPSGVPCPDPSGKLKALPSTHTRGRRKGSPS